MYDDILIPVDTSDEDSGDVTDQALFLADVCDATLHILHVVDERAYTTIPSEARDRIRDTLEEDGQDATRSVAEQAIDRGIEVHREVRWGEPTVGILSFARDNDVDLIVMGTHARTGYERFLLGSVAEKVVRTADVPVLTTRLTETSEDVVAELGGESID